MKKPTFAGIHIGRFFPKNLLVTALLFTIGSSSVFTQNEPKWVHFTGSDNVNDLEFSGDTAWVASDGGLSLYSISQNALLENHHAGNSAIGKNHITTLAVGPGGTAWLSVIDASITGGTGKPGLKYFDGTSFLPAASNSNLLNGAYALRNLIATPQGDLFFTEQVNFSFEIRLWKLSNGLLEQIPMPNAVTATELMALSDDGTIWVYFSESKMGSFDGTDWTVHDLIPVLGVPVTVWFSLKKGPNNAVYFDLETNDPSSDRRMVRYLNGQWEELPFWTEFPGYDFGSDGELYVLEGGKLLRYDDDHYTEVLYFTPVGTAGYFLNYKFAPDGKAWTVFQPQWQSSIRQLYAMDGNTAEPIHFGNSSLPSNLVTGVKIDGNGNKIIVSGMEAWLFDGMDWQRLEDVEINDAGETEVLPDHRGNTWFFPKNSNTVQWLHDGVITNFPVSPNQPGRKAIHPDNRLFYDNAFESHFQTMDSTGAVSNTEIPRPVTSQYPPNMLFDTSGSLWIYNVEWANNRPQRWNGSAWEDVLIPFSFAGGENALAYIDESQNVYFSGGYGQIAIFDQADTVWTELYINDTDTLFHFSTHLQKDSKNNLWAISQDGLYKYDGLDWTVFNDGLPSNRLRDFSVDRYDNLWIATENGLAVFNENGIKTLGGKEVYRLEGRVYFDANNDSLFTTGVDAPVAFQRVVILPDSVQLLTEETGKFGLNLLEGDYEVKISPPPHWNTKDGSNSIAVVLDTASVTNADLRLVPDSLFDKSELYLTGNIARCDREATYYFGFRNTGTTTLNGRVFVAPDILTPILSAAPVLQFDTTSGNYFADLTGVLPFSLAQFKIQTYIPGVLYINQPIDWKAWYHPNAQPLPADSVAFTQPVLCAYDPNDKLALSAGPTQDGLSLLRDELLYTIRFQNTGNDTAFTVEIRDTLDADLDWATFRVLQASHPLATFFKENGAIRFLFENILLPDSISNEPASHGFVQYAVRAKMGLPEPVAIENTAFIYFDSNPPIVTNTTENLLVEAFPIVDASEDENPALPLFKITPNPVGGEAHLFVEMGGDEPAQLVVKDMAGRAVWSKKLTGVCQPCRLDMDGLSAGAYMASLIKGGLQQHVIFIKR